MRRGASGQQKLVFDRRQAAGSIVLPTRLLVRASTAPPAPARRR
jgi:hypothetical protein